MSDIKTKSGLDFFEVSSAYQKCIRRGMEEDALHFAYELYISGFAKYFWKRTLIIASEDVGLADPDAVGRVMQYHDMYLHLNELNDAHERLAIFQAVIYLSRAKKSRLVDWTKMCVVNQHKARLECDPDSPNALLIPECALDVHTRRGKANGKTVLDFFTEGSHLENHEELPEEAERRDWAENFHKAPKYMQEAARPPVGSNNPLRPDADLDVCRNGTVVEQNGQKWLF